MAEAREPITSGTRSKTVDIVKGIAITLVVFGHTAQGMIHRGWWNDRTAILSDAFIYSFHMPAFFFVAGLFALGSLAKRGARHFAVDKAKTILYPYLLFALITAALEPLIGRFKMGTAAFHWNSFLTAIVDGDAGWFLFVLFVCLMLALLTSRVPGWVRFAAAVGIALIPPVGPETLGKVLREFCFMAAGMWVGVRIFSVDRMRTTTAAIGFVVFAAFQLAMIYHYGPSALWLWTFIVLGLSGTAGLFLLARVLDVTPLGDGIAWVGQASLSVFLLSAFAQGAVREILLRVFHTRELYVQLLVPTLVATVLPAIIWHQQDRWRLGWLFRWPFGLRRSQALNP